MKLSGLWEDFSDILESFRVTVEPLKGVTNVQRVGEIAARVLAGLRAANDNEKLATVPEKKGATAPARGGLKMPPRGNTLKGRNRAAD